jgi:outer membrane protein, adhesin transport system
MSVPPITPPSRRRCRRTLAAAAGLLACVLACLPAAASPPCGDELAPELARADAAAAATSDMPRRQLLALVETGLARSQAVGAARLLAEAAARDTDEARAALAPQAGLGGRFGPAYTESGGASRSTALQGQVSINIGQLVYDGGRSQRLVDWRRLLADAAVQGEMNLQEQLALNTVVLALERHRYAVQLQVYDQYARTMRCLVDALQATVAADRGRASELVQAGQSLAQVELARADALSQQRQVEVRLRRLVGDAATAVDGLPHQLRPVPELAGLLAEAERTSEIAQLGAQAAALDRLADAVQASARPQLSWVLAGTRVAEAGSASAQARGGDVSVGLALNVPLVTPGAAPAADAARRRALAALAQRDDALDARRFRISDVHEQSRAALERAERVRAVLQSSEQVRDATRQQWLQLGRRSLFDVIGAEAEHYGLRLAYVNALHDAQQLNANLIALGRGLVPWLR